MSSAEGHRPVGRRCSAQRRDVGARVPERYVERRRASARGPKVFCAVQKGIGPWAEGVLRSAEGHRPVGRRCSAGSRRVGARGPERYVERRRALARGPKVFCREQTCRCPRTGALCRAQKGIGPWAEGVLHGADEAREHRKPWAQRRRRLAGWAPATPAGRRPRTGGRRGVRACSLVTGRALAAPMKHRSFRHGHARAGRARAGRRPRTDGGDPAKTAAAGRSLSGNPQSTGTPPRQPTPGVLRVYAADEPREPGTPPRQPAPREAERVNS
jgi:hypothetical protein